ncbi:hypothetical protein [Streptomyces sudanensis]|uniref:hypothetical protein n=1 Tax=Streptomyces sudanensis TaxID=436397 RepID=UPI0020CEE291|nr:hypothetical protein [Streptomyces sudanensis]MCP9959505.1 hypothetical protein [Streptomyces sudanensis]MCQ0000050.1 hypothetical protein [Streptomyces sudanensis]
MIPVVARETTPVIAAVVGAVAATAPIVAPPVVVPPEASAPVSTAVPVVAPERRTIVPAPETATIVAAVVTAEAATAPPIVVATRGAIVTRESAPLAPTVPTTRFAIRTVVGGVGGHGCGSCLLVLPAILAQWAFHRASNKSGDNKKDLRSQHARWDRRS